MFFKRKKKKVPEPAKLPDPGLLVLLESLPALDVEAIRSRVAKAEKLRLLPKIDEVVDDAENGEVRLIDVSFDSHEIRVLFVNQPLPERVYKDIVDLSFWPSDVKEPMHAHAAHAVLMHQGGGANPLEKMVALYKLGAALTEPFYLRGVVNENCLSCISSEMTLDFLNPDTLKTMRDTPPPFAFQGFLQIEDGLWATRGHHIFGMPDFAMHATDDLSAEGIMSLFLNIFLYVNVSDMQIAAGHTMQAAEDLYLRFEEFTHVMWDDDRPLLKVVSIPANETNK
ncbi:DUF4261 domain-containing protein [Planctomycetota bacterium]|nr:DUF4261 domain-containing protein [Planctomycetota bacterium]